MRILAASSSDCNCIYITSTRTWNQLGVILEARGLRKYFPIKKSFRQFFKSSQPELFVKAVDDVSFVVEPGKVLVFAGASGSGKTTVARLVMRAIEPDSGSIIFEDKD